ncbi:MAG: AI-2E family transporter [Flavobacteriaceae bacterium]|nr:AI-2E family transporter [Flavobacteriaceae bacterium]
MKEFKQKIIYLVFVVAVLALVLNAFHIGFLAFAGLLIAIFFHGLASRIERLIKMHRLVSLGISIILVNVLVVGAFLLVGATLSEQYTRFEQILPNTLRNLQNYAEGYAVAEDALQNALSFIGNTDKIASSLGYFFQYTFGFFGDLYAITFFAVFFIATPIDYVKGIVLLTPKANERTAEQILRKIGSDLRIWLKAQLILMFFIFVTTAIGLLIIGVELWLILALIAGLLCFIPNIGPTVALIPALLVGLLDGVQTTLLILLVYMLVQLIETGFVGPYVRKRMLSIPPALLLFFQFVLGALTGAWGLLLATPLLVVLMILFGKLYVKDYLKKKIK